MTIAPHPGFMQRVTLALAVLLSASCVDKALAQEASPVRRLGAVLMGGGSFVSVDPFFGRGDLLRLAPGSELLSRDLSGYTYSTDDLLSGEGSFDLGISFFPCAKEARNGPELRVGVLFGNGPSLRASESRTTRSPYDTLTSSLTGERVLVDSVNTSEYELGYGAERFGLNGSLVWRRPGRWSLYGGAGLMGGVLMNARTTVSHRVDVRTDNGSSYPWNAGDDTFADVPVEEESFRNGTGWWFGAYVPLGLDWRAGTVSPFWSRVHFCYELRPQLVIQNIPELATATGGGMQALFLARIEL